MTSRLASSSRLAALGLVLSLLGCEGDPPTFEAPDRAIGDRTPLTRTCDELDTTSCLLPWPSSAFTTADPSRPTGLRLEVDLAQLNRMDDATMLRRADGFSRVSSMIVGFPRAIDPASARGAVHVMIAQHDHPDFGREAPVRTEVIETGRNAWLLVAHPLVPLTAGVDYVVVVDDSLRAEDGMPLEPTRGTQLALDLVPAFTEEEAALVGYHAPMRSLLASQGIDPSRVLRAWDFTTRSAEDPIRRLRAMRQAAIDAVDEGRVTVRIDVVNHRETGPVATIVEGALVGLPNFLTPEGLSADEAGEALAVGTREAPFRLALPRGEGDYRMLMYGHGTGGTVRDASFDDAITDAGAAKFGIEFYGWTESSVFQTFSELQNMARGSSIAIAGLVQAVADASALRRAAGSILGDALSAPELGGMPNPHEGRRPDDSVPMWVGGSLGGTMGLVFSAADPEVEHAVLNVPGAAWTTWVRQALQFGLIAPGITRRNGGDVSMPIAVAMAQTLFDEADGASWYDVLQEQPLVALVQDSIGDPVVPNPGSEMVARVVDAVQIGGVITPVDEIATATEANGRSAFTQYRVEDTGPFDVHGFAARNTPAAAAAREQILDFVHRAWAGEPRITVPASCPDGRCDFAP